MSHRLSTIGRVMRLLIVLALLALAFNLFTPTPSAQASSVTTYTGVINGAAYKVEVPTPWNGTAVLYSHGYTAPGSPNPARNVGDPATGAMLLAQGYALAGSAYRTTGWALEQAFEDQIALLDWFNANVGAPQRTIAWGHSLCGIITAGLIQKYPARFSGALPMCGVLGGGVGIWNQVLDGAFVFKTLIAPNTPIQVVNIANPPLNYALALQALDAAQATPAGRARIALMSAMGNIHGWFTAGAPEPDAHNYVLRQYNQYLWARHVDFAFVYLLRAELEARAGGNFSWNTDVNYRKQLERSTVHAEVQALYAEAGLSLEGDLRALDEAPRIVAVPSAVDYVRRNIVFDGAVRVPVLTLHTTADGLVPVENEQAYASTVRAAGNGALLRDLYVNRAGHCTFTPAETLTAFQMLINRLNTGRWGSSDAAPLNETAVAYGPALNILPPSFVIYQPFTFSRPFDAGATYSPN